MQQWLFLIGLFLIIGLLYYYRGFTFRSSNKTRDQSQENFYSAPYPPISENKSKTVNKVVPNTDGGEEYKNVFKTKSGNVVASEYPKKKTLQAKDLLPQGKKQWGRGCQPIDFEKSYRNLIENKNFIIGKVTPALRNPSLDIRCEVPNPRKIVSPWNQSTIRGNEFNSKKLQPCDVGCKI